MTELNLRSEHLGASTDSPGDNRLGNFTLLDGLDDSVLFGTTNLTEEEEHLALGIGFVSEQVVNERSTGVSITTDSNTLVNTVGSVGQDVVELVRHTTRLGNVSDGTGSVKLAGNQVVHHTTSVSDSETSRLDTTDSSGTDDDDTSADGELEELSSVSLGDTFGNDTDSLDLGEGQDVEGRGVNGSGRREVDDNVDVRVLFDGLGDGRVDREKGLLGTPVEFLNVVTTEGVDHSGD